MIEAAASIGLSLIGLIVWLVKLEAKANRNTELIVQVQSQLKDHLTKCEDSQERILDTLKEIKDIVNS